MTFRYEVRYDGLNKFQVVRGQTPAEAKLRAETKIAAWNEQYRRMLERETKRIEGDIYRTNKSIQSETATERTAEAEQAVESLFSLLRYVVNKSTAFDPDNLRIRGSFGEPQPMPSRPLSYQAEPDPSQYQYLPKFDFWDRISKTRRKRKVLQSKASFERDHAQWAEDCRKFDQQNRILNQKFETDLASWNSRKDSYEIKKTQSNEGVDKLISGYESGQPSFVAYYFKRAIKSVPLPDVFSGDFELSFNESTRTLIVDFDLPELESLPKLKGVRYVASKDKFEETLHKVSFLQNLFDNVVYQTSLSIAHIVFLSDGARILNAIVFNGWTTYLHRATGHDTTACIASLHVTRDEFQKISLLQVEPKACFRSLKGISSPQLHSLTPVKPIISMNRKDSRFVESHDVIERIGHGTNIAAIGWEEFEHLIREVFEKEFSAGGGEVKVTQASRDGGVDAIAFDPDPIRGGKIIIQAKRYTNTVDVSAVRDLFGTVMSEGATKGILVTTSSFGPDAYGFAKGKPITLLDGNNLLYLLTKHGFNARIDLVEAKKIGNPLQR